MAQPFDALKIQHQWPALDLTKPDTLTAELRRYAGYYGINFEDKLDAITHHFGFLKIDDFHIACHVWSPAKPCGTVLITHGYFDHVGIYRHLIRFFLDQNLVVVAYDQPGHGLSSGNRASIQQFSSYQAVLDACLATMQTLPSPYYCLAQSMGGAILIDYLLHNDKPAFDKVWLLAPLVWPSGWDSKKYLHATLRYFVGHIPRNFALNSHDLGFLNFLEHKDPLQPREISVAWVTAWKQWLPNILSATPSQFPATIIQGSGDTSVDWEKNLPVFRTKLPQSQLHILKGARHQLVNESKKYRLKLYTIIKQQLAQPAKPT